jgi:hypothetical protein
MPVESQKARYLHSIGDRLEQSLKPHVDRLQKTLRRYFGQRTM